MGGYTNIFGRIWNCLEQRSLWRILAGVGLIALMGGAPSPAAETDENRSNRSVVSTSPTDLAEPGSADARPATARSMDDPPLTRAAMQLHIDEMSPTHWLAQFGTVSIGRRD
jgi:hypothetical protein